MATTYTLTGSLLDAGVPFVGDKVLAWIALANVNALIDTTTDSLVVGRWPVATDGTGNLSEVLPSTASGAGYSPDGGFAFQLYIEYRDSAPYATRERFVSQPFTLTANSTLADVLGGTIELRSVSAAEWADFQAKYDEIKDVVATTDGVMAAADADAGSDFRTQQDARLSAMIAEATAGLASKSYSEHTISGAVSIAADGTRALTLTGNAVVTLTGANGDDVVLDVVYNGHLLTVAGLTFVGGSPLAAVKSRGVWIITGGEPDVTAPTAPTSLTADPDITSVVLTWAASTDAVGVAGYQHRTGSGSWVDDGLVLTKTVTGLTANTAYTFEVRAYDAAGNFSTAASVSTTTDVDPSAAYDIFDSFTAADGTAVVGRTTTKGGLVWAGSSAHMGGSGSTSQITSGRVEWKTALGVTNAAAIVLSQADAVSSCDYDLSAGSAATAERRVYVFVRALDANSSDVVSFQIRADGSLICLKGGITAVTLTGDTTGYPTTGRLSVSAVGDTFTATVGAKTASVTIVPGSGYSGTGRRTGFAVRNDLAKIDNFGVDLL